MNLDVEPELGALRSNDIDVGSVNGTHAARGRLSVWLDLHRNQHGLLCRGGETCLLGKFGDQVPDPIVSSSVQSFCATRRMSAIWV